ncbi:MAG: hypothetical protein K0S74_1054 [Chlamydiales bacterium]|nr:hypothetical protein [Chlamydiales bacterium]
MFSIKLFVGFQVDYSIKKSLDSVNPNIIKLFIRSQGDYLQQIEYDGESYIGKILDDIMSMDSIEQLERHIHSIARKVIPNYSDSNKSLEILTIQDSSYPV